MALHTANHTRNLLPKEMPFSVSSGLLLAMPGCDWQLIGDLWGQGTQSPARLPQDTYPKKPLEVVAPVRGFGLYSDPT